DRCSFRSLAVQGGGMNTSLTKKIGLALLTAVALLVLISWASFQTLSDARQAADGVRHAQEVLAKLETVVAHLMTAESEARAYFPTADQRQQELYRAALPKLQQELTTLRTLTAETPDQHQRLQVLEDRITQRLVNLNTGVELAGKHLLLAEKRLALMREGS